MGLSIPIYMPFNSPLTRHRTLRGGANVYAKFEIAQRPRQFAKLAGATMRRARHPATAEQPGSQGLLEPLRLLRGTDYLSISLIHVELYFSPPIAITTCASFPLLDCLGPPLVSSRASSLLRAFSNRHPGTEGTRDLPHARTIPVATHIFTSTFSTFIDIKFVYLSLPMCPTTV